MRARGWADRARLNPTPSARALLPILYKRYYIPIYIFTRTHTYLTFFPFHIVYSSYVRRGQLARMCALPPFEPNETNAPLFYLRVFRKGEAFIPFLYTVHCSRTQCSEYRTVKYFFSIYKFHFWSIIFYPAGSFINLLP